MKSIESKLRRAVKFHYPQVHLLIRTIRPDVTGRKPVSFITINGTSDEKVIKQINTWAYSVQIIPDMRDRYGRR